MCSIASRCDYASEWCRIGRYVVSVCLTLDSVSLCVGHDAGLVVSSFECLMCLRKMGESVESPRSVL